jgi:ribosome recycling factor
MTDDLPYYDSFDVNNKKVTFFENYMENWITVKLEELTEEQKKELIEECQGIISTTKDYIKILEKK